MRLLIALLTTTTIAVPALGREVAFAPLQGDASEAVRNQIEGALREAALTFVEVQDAAVTAEHFSAGASSLSLECVGQDLECWRRLLELAGVERLLVPGFSAGKLDLTVVARDARDDDRGALQLSGSLAVGTARKLVARLLDVRAQLTVLSNVSGAIVELDGVVIGQAPFPEPVTGIKAGTHVLKVIAIGKPIVERTFVIDPGEDAVLKIDLAVTAKEPKAQGFSTGFWVGAAAGVAGIVSMTAGALVVSSGPTSPTSPVLHPTPQEVDQILADRRQSEINQIVGVTLAVVGTALVTVGSFLLLE